MGSSNGYTFGRPGDSLSESDAYDMMTGQKKDPTSNSDMVSYFSDINKFFDSFAQSLWTRPFKESEGYKAFSTKNGAVVVFDTAGVSEKDIRIMTKPSNGNLASGSYLISVAGASNVLPDVGLKYSVNYTVSFQVPSYATVEKIESKVLDGFTYVFFRLKKKSDPSNGFTKVVPDSGSSPVDW